MSDDVSFGAWLKARRKELDLTQEALAEAAGCSADMVRKIEAGVARPSRQLAELLVARLQVAPEEQPALVQWARSGTRPQEVHQAPLAAAGSPENPYKGLRAFGEQDAPDFFGRTDLTVRLVSRLFTGEPLSRFLSVVGPSGSGKSSVIRAGLVPALRRERLPGGLEPLVVELVPGDHPLEELEAALLRVAANPPASLMEQLEAGERGLARAVKRVLPPDKPQGLLLVIDQLEELFTLAKDEQECATLLTGLFAAVTDPHVRLWVVVSLRADFYDQTLLYAPSAELVGKRTEGIGPLSPAELYQAITGPAARVGLELENDLTPTIIDDVGRQPGALPLMEYALTELYERREGRLLTLRAYQQIGGVLGALVRRAEDLYSGLSSTEQAEAHQMFLRLVALGDGAPDTRRRVRRAEIASAARDEEALGRVLDLYGRYRMLTFDRDPLSGGPTVEVAHEALLQHWPRLQQRLDHSRAALRVQRRLMAAAGEWQATGRETSYLASGARLAEFETLSAPDHEQEPLALTADEQAYLTASLEQQRRTQEEEQAQQRRERALQQQAVGRLRMLAAALMLFLLIAGALAAWALNRSAVAQANEEVARANLTHTQALRLALEAGSPALQGDSQLVGLLAVRSINTEYTPEGDAALEKAAAAGYPPLVFAGHTAGVRGVAFSPDGKYVLTAGDDHTARIWDAKTAQQIRLFGGHGAQVYTAVFSPDGRYVLTASADRTARLWDSATARQLHSFSGNGQEVLAAVFSPDGRRVLTAGFDKAAHLWDIGGDPSSPGWGRLLLDFSGHDDGVVGAVFSADGKYVVTSSIDKTARIWDAATGQPLHILAGHGDAIDAVAISPDGKRVATGSGDRTARVWDAASGKPLYTTTAHSDYVEGVAFSPDGRYLLTGSSDGTARLWDAASGQEARQYVKASGEINRVAFSPDGAYFLTGAGGQPSLAQLWRTQLPSGELQLVGHSGALWQAQFSGDGKRVLTASADGTARIWDAATGRELRRFDVVAAPMFELWSAVFSPDEKYMLTTSTDRLARLWDVAGGTPVVTYTGHTDSVRMGAFSPDGKYVATTSYDGTARVWEALTGRAIVTFTSHISATPGQSHNVNRLMFSPDGKRIVTSGDDGTARVWDPFTGKELLVLRGHAASVAGVAFSPDGSRIVTGGADGTARLWDAGSGEEIGRFIGHTGPVYGARFSPDGRYVLTTGADETARLWNVSSKQEVRRFSGHSALVRDATLSPDSRYVITAGGDGIARIWHTDYHDTISYVCDLLTRDLTPNERTKYDIADQGPTCPAP